MCFVLGQNHEKFAARAAQFLAVENHFEEIQSGLLNVCASKHWRQPYFLTIQLARWIYKLIQFLTPAHASSELNLLNLAQMAALVYGKGLGLLARTLGC